MLEIENERLDTDGSIPKETMKMLRSQSTALAGVLLKSLHVPPNTRQHAMLWLLDDNPFIYEFYEDDGDAMAFNNQFYIVDDREDLEFMAIGELGTEAHTLHFERLLEKINDYNEMSKEERIGVLLGDMNPLNSTEEEVKAIRGLLEDYANYKNKK